MARLNQYESLITLTWRDVLVCLQLCLFVCLFVCLGKVRPGHWQNKILNQKTFKGEIV